MVSIFLKKYKKIDDEQDEKIKEIFDALNEKNKKYIVKRAKVLTKTAIIYNILVFAVFFAAFLFALFLSSNGWFFVLIFILLLGCFFGYHVYAATTWNKVEHYELIRIVGIDQAIYLLDKQNK